MLVEANVQAAPCPGLQPCPAAADGSPSPQPQARLGLHDGIDHDVSAVTMERVCFDDVTASVAGLNSPPSRRNVNTSRGPLPSLPFHIQADACMPVRQVVSNFAMDICRDVSPPMVAAPPPRRRARSPPKTVAIRCSERLARKSRHRATKPAIQAQNVLMKA
jgi:hypothetical protein